MKEITSGTEVGDRLKRMDLAAKVLHEVPIIEYFDN